MPKITLSTGKVLEVADEYGPEETLRAAELADVPADMSYADTILFNLATVVVAVKKVDGKSLEDLAGKATRARDVLMAFRKVFADSEWKELTAATSELYKLDKQAPVGKYVIES